ncbi:hypothetical protein [Acidaminobacter hydrogenoformans]|uniref:DUF2680 domain-containing protein n=1 Tax=Acidaminobacter hydrogenoformans DSM 2784 TaxID=1120920 RepID=A0A1G5RYQ7_9FIRM|nr:hypothetical protein [Acidaminobacter hydrogenoformans]SCZ79067.1 hypothetical protein SAMN03080599_01577 [Acidaminobacter hydrogenoformans DSM 2784]
MKKMLLSLSLILVLALGSVVVFADETPTVKGSVEILSELSGLSEEAIVDGVKAGSTLSEQAQEKGVFDQFVEAVKANRALRIEQLAADGKLTQERAKAMIDFMQNYDCDGTQTHAMRAELNNGERFGLGNGQAAGGQGLAKQNGLSNGNPENEAGQGLRNGISAEGSTGGRGMMRGNTQGAGQGMGVNGFGMGANAVPAQ